MQQPFNVQPDRLLHAGNQDIGKDGIRQITDAGSGVQEFFKDRVQELIHAEFHVDLHFVHFDLPVVDRQCADGGKPASGILAHDLFQGLRELHLPARSNVRHDAVGRAQLVVEKYGFQEDFICEVARIAY